MKKVEYEGNKNIISKKLKEIRISKNISQEELASKMQVLNVNIDQQMVSKIEKNIRQVTDYEFLAFCKCLDVTPDELMDCNFKQLKK